MKVTFNKKTNLPVVEFEDSDFMGAQYIAELMDGHFTCRKCSSVNVNTAWETLLGYYESWRGSIEELGKANARSRARNVLCGNVFSILDGFDMAVSIPRKVVLQAEMLQDQKNKKEKLDGPDESDE